MTQTAGRIVRVRTFDWKDGSHVDTTWWAAIEDDDAAVKAVMLAVKARADDHQVEVVGILSPAEVSKAGLGQGQAAPASAG